MKYSGNPIKGLFLGGFEVNFSDFQEKFRQLYTLSSHWRDWYFIMVPA